MAASIFLHIHSRCLCLPVAYGYFTCTMVYHGIQVMAEIGLYLNLLMFLPKPYHHVTGNTLGIPGII